MAIKIPVPIARIDCPYVSLCPLDGDLAVHYNRAERIACAVLAGRLNWTLFGGDLGGKRSAVLTSFMASTRRL
jgi:hypothetical protein